MLKTGMLTSVLTDNNKIMMVMGLMEWMVGEFYGVDGKFIELGIWKI